MMIWRVLLGKMVEMLYHVVYNVYANLVELDGGIALLGQHKI